MINNSVFSIILNILSIAIPVFSLILSIYANIRSKRAYNEDHRGKVIAYFEIRNNDIYIVIKNIGNSIAYNISVDFTPKLSTIIHSDFNKVQPLIVDYKNYTLVPGQEISEKYDITKYKFRKFDISISYMSFKDIPYTENYKLDTYYLDTYKI